MAERRGRFGGNPPTEKPYAFVPIPAGDACRERPPGHDRYIENLVTGTLEGVILACSPVHVASGQIELTGKQPPLVKAHFRRNDRLTIPGSSLKGTIRSIVEAISSPPSCLRVTRARTAEQPTNVQACTDKEHLCIACRMFGAMGYLGQIRFHDAVLEAGEPAIIPTPSLFAPRTRERLYAVGGKIAGRKFYRHGALARGNVPLEVCPPDSRFHLRADFENLSYAQLSLFLIALGQGEPKLHPKLGGAKPACCGSVEIRVTGVQTVSARATALDYDAAPRQLDVASMTGLTQLVNREVLQHLAQVLAYPGEGQCPDGTY